MMNDIKIVCNISEFITPLENETPIFKERFR